MHLYHAKGLVEHPVVLKQFYFKSIHGHCNVPYNYSENRVLAKWCDTQRQAFKNNKLAQDKIKQLDDLGFSWSLRKVEGQRTSVNLAKGDKPYHALS